MALKKVIIKGFKSIEYCSVDLTNSNFFIGENGVGKSNIIEAIDYFYNNLTSRNTVESVFDINNKFRNEIIIELQYDISNMNTIYNTTEDRNTKIYLNKIKSISRGKKSDTIVAKFRQIKGGKTFWNVSYEHREIIKGMFPMYLMNSNHANSLDWNPIWQLVGDVVKLPHQKQKELQNEIKEIIMENTKNDKNLSEIDIILNDLEVSFDKWNPNQYGQNISKVYYGGNTFENKQLSLDKFSTGTTVLLYYTLFFKLMNILSSKKIKEPLILIDEAEIYLHHKHIDRWYESLSSLTRKTTTIVSTHSSRLIKNAIISDKVSNIYQVTLNNKYSNYQKLNLFNSPGDLYKYRLSDEHANAYFSSVMLLVEGETELEIFNNTTLKKIFDILKIADVYKSMTDDIIKDKIIPTTTRSNVPYLAIVDIDKVSSFRTVKNEIDSGEITKISIDFFKEGLYYKIDTTRESLSFEVDQRLKLSSREVVRNRIVGMHSKLNFSVDQNSLSKLLHCSDDRYYEMYLRLLKYYFLSYNIFIFKNTIEGSIINHETLSYLKEFIRYEQAEFARGKNEIFISKSQEELNRSFDKIEKFDLNTQLNYFRMLMNGKSDYNKGKLIELLKSNEPFKRMTTCFNKSLGGSERKKTNWVTRFINFYFNIKIYGLEEGVSPDLQNLTFQEGVNYFSTPVINNKIVKNSLANSFQSDFKELYSVIARLDYLYYNRREL